MARQQNLDVTHMSTAMQQGAPFQVMLSQFRYVIETLSTKIEAEIKLRHLGLIISSAPKVTSAVQPEHRTFYNNHSNTPVGIIIDIINNTSVDSTLIIHSIVISTLACND